MITSFSLFNGATFDIFMNMTQCNVLIFSSSRNVNWYYYHRLHRNNFYLQCVQDPATCFNITTVFPGREIPIVKTRRQWDRLIFIMGIPTLIIWYLSIEMIPNGLLQKGYSSESYLYHLPIIYFYSVESFRNVMQSTAVILPSWFVLSYKSIYASMNWP